MTARSLLFIMIFSFVIGGCRKDNPSGNNEEDFVKGQVLVGIDSTVSLELTFNYINALSLSISQASGFTFTTTLGKDHIPSIVELLNSKPYINHQGFSASVWEHYQSGIVYNTSFLWNMTRQNQVDYLSTLNNLKMKEKLTPYRSVSIMVPEGMEKLWINKLKNEKWVSWAELNYHSKIAPWE